MVAVLGTAVTLSTRFFSPLELQDHFADGQKLYALGDYERAIKRYQAIIDTKSNATINVEEVTVDVDEFILPVKVAATYQLANSYNKLGLEKLRRSNFLLADKKEKEAEERRGESLEALQLSLNFFRALANDENIEQRTRVMAQFQTLETNYQLKKYEQVIVDGQTLISTFPNSVYEPSAYYNMGWSNFELGNYQKAIDNFNQTLLLAPRGSSADRAIFQVAEAQDQLGDYNGALATLDRLISRYDFAKMSEEEIIEMTTQKLKGLVKETVRELIAKAQMKKGDIYANKGEIDKAMAAMALVPTEYEAETALVQQSYIRTAELLREKRGTQAAIAAYKNAIEKVDDKKFQAKTQLTVGLMLFEEEEYAKAAQEYQIYLDAYADVSQRIGFGRDKALFRIAQSHQAQAQKVRGEDPDAGEAAVDKALSVYQQFMDEYSENELVPDVLFGMGFCKQLKKKSSDAKPFYNRLVDSYPRHGAAPNALLQLARIAFEADDYSEAEGLYRSFLETYPDSDLRDNAQMELGLTYKRTGNVDAAITAYENVDPAWGQWIKIQVELADLYVGKENYKQAETVLRQALGKTEEKKLLGQLHYIKARIHFAQEDYEGAIFELGQTLALPISPSVQESALLARGSAHYEVAKLQDAAADTTKAKLSYEMALVDMKELLERNPAPNIKDSAFRTLGASMIRLKLEAEAAQYYEQLIENSDDAQEAATFQMLLTELYFDMQDFAQAQRHATNLLGMKFKDDNTAGYYRKERAYSIIGNSLLQQQAYKEAGDIFARGLKEYPNSGESANLAFSKAFAQFSAQAYDQSAKSFKYYIDKYSANRNLIHGYYYLAHSHQALTNFKEASDAFSKLAELFPKSNYEEEALFLVGENYYNDRDYVQAADAYLRLLNTYAQGIYGDAAQYALAWSYFEEEKMEEGVQAIKELVERYPQSEYASKSQFTVGDYYYNIRSYDEALVAYQRLVDDYPDSDETPRARALIDELSEIQASFDYAKVMQLFETEKYSEAISGFKGLIAKYPGTYTELAAYCNMSLSYEIMRQWSEAAENYQMVLNKGGDDPESFDVVNFARLHREWIVENRL
jgi:tetratricopeptide (TPR) repeat protein